MTLCRQLPHTQDHGLEFVDPNDQLKVKDKALKDMGKDNFDLSALPCVMARGANAF